MHDATLYGYVAGWDAATGDRIDSIGKTHTTKTGIEIRLPKDAKPGVYDVRYGLVCRQQPDRPNLPIESETVYGRFKRDGIHQVSAGAVRVDGKGGPLEWLPPSVENAEQERLLETNAGRQLVDFGGVKTDGAFRIEWKPDLCLTPLPGSGPFRVRLDLTAFGMAAATVASVEVIDADAGAVRPAWRQEGAVFGLKADGRAFAYRIRFLNR